MAKKGKSAVSPASQPDQPPLAQQAQNPEADHSQHVPPNAQLLPPGLLSPKPLLKVAKDKLGGGNANNKELWLIQVPRAVSIQSLEGMQVEWPIPDELVLNSSGAGAIRMQGAIEARPCSVQGVPHTLMTQALGGTGPGGSQGKGTVLMVPVMMQNGTVLLPVDRRLVLVKGHAQLDATDDEEEEQNRLLLKDVKEINKADSAPAPPQLQSQSQQGKHIPRDKHASKKKAKHAQQLNVSGGSTPVPASAAETPAAADAQGQQTAREEHGSKKKAKRAKRAEEEAAAGVAPATGVQGQGGEGSGYALSDDGEDKPSAKKKQKKEKKRVREGSEEEQPQTQKKEKKEKKRKSAGGEGL